MISYKSVNVQSRLTGGEMYRPITRLLRELDVDMSKLDVNGNTQRDSETDGRTDEFRKPIHALLPEEQTDELPVHGPDGK